MQTGSGASHEIGTASYTARYIRVYWPVRPCPARHRTVEQSRDLPAPEQTRGTQKQMTDHYQSFVSSPIGKLFVKNLGLPNPTPLERWSEGAPVVDGTVVTGGSG